MDEQIGKIVAALEGSRFASNTTVVYSSDHGDNMGVRGTWNKCLLYKESTAVPMILCGPSVPAGKVCRTPVGLHDLYPPIKDHAGIGRHLYRSEESRVGKECVSTCKYRLSSY